MTTDLKSYTPPEKCKCEGKGCSHCQLKLTLKAKGPCMIYASDLKSRDPAVKPVYPKIPIVKLLKNQSLELEATAVLGHGKAHAKWIPCLVWYKKKPRIEVGNVKNPEEVVEATHGKIFEIKNNKLEIIREDIFKYDLVNAAEKVSKGEIRAEYEDDYIFYIESWGQLEPKKILLEALRLLKEKFDQVEDKISIK